MPKAETHLQQPDRYICEPESRINRQEMLIAKPEQGDRTAALSCARDLLTALLAGLDAFRVHGCALLLRGN